MVKIRRLPGISAKIRQESQFCKTASASGLAAAPIFLKLRLAQSDGASPVYLRKAELKEAWVLNPLI